MRAIDRDGIDLRLSYWAARGDVPLHAIHHLDRIALLEGDPVRSAVQGMIDDIGAVLRDGTAAGEQAWKDYAATIVRNNRGIQEVIDSLRGSRWAASRFASPR